MSRGAWVGSEADRELMMRLWERYRSIPGDHYDNYLKLCLGLTIDALAKDFVRPDVYQRVERKYERRRLRREVAQTSPSET